MQRYFHPLAHASWTALSHSTLYIPAGSVRSNDNKAKMYLQFQFHGQKTIFPASFPFGSTTHYCQMTALLLEKRLKIICKQLKYHSSRQPTWLTWGGSPSGCHDSDTCVTLRGTFHSSRGELPLSKWLIVPFNQFPSSSSSTKWDLVVYNWKWAIWKIKEPRYHRGSSMVQLLTKVSGSKNIFMEITFIVSQSCRA